MSRPFSLRRAFDLFQAHDYRAARDAYEAYTRDHDSDWRAKLWYARAIAELGETDTALTVLDSVILRLPDQPVAHTFKALILFDSGRFEHAEQTGDDARLRGGGALAKGILLLSRVRRGHSPMPELLRILSDGNAELRGRALHLAEERLASFAREVQRDLMDEVGIGWPGYAFLPPWLFKRSRLQRRVWRLLAGNQVDEACRLVAELKTHSEELSRGEREAMIAAAMVARDWESASWWALTLNEYRGYVMSETAPHGLVLFQLSLFRGVCLLMTGEHRESLAQFEIAGEIDRTSYLPYYFGAKAHVLLGNQASARRKFVDACDTLNPSLASLRWQELLSTGSRS